MFKKVKVTCSPGVSLLESLRDLGEIIPAPCGGKGICGKCHVVVDGSGEVRSCSCYPDGEVVVSVPLPSAMQVLTESFWPDPEPLADQWPESETRHLGAAVDLGTTTVVVFLDDLRTHRNLAIQTFSNPQALFGADVVSRIHYCQQHPEGTDRLHREIVGSIERALTGLVAEAGFLPDQLTRIAVAGNPTMLHLFRGVSPVSLAEFPFTPVFLEEQSLRGSEAGMTRFPDAAIELIPSVSSYLGADIVAGLAAVSFNPPEGWSLFLDIGTNGEMVLWNGDKLLSCATAAGPAFEGARISCGMPGVEGAVSAIRDGRFETIGNKPATGLCGSGLVDGVAQLLDEGKIDMMGYLEADTRLEPLNLFLTPQDIREVQLAKGAIAAGIRVLIHEAGITTEEIRRVFMAGGFGYALHEWSSARIGLIPAGLDKKQIRAGNTSGLGARLWIHSGEFRTYTRSLSQKIRYVALSEHQEFNDLFMWEMTFPEKS